jgi:DNA polymerase III subunit gamma/tau
MENFIVSARKYRPGTFGFVVGQKSITSTLKNAIKNNHMAQAYLFCGPRGVGKTTCARIFAKTINCQNISEDIEPCNECESCKSFNSNRSLNIHELDAASNNSVDDIRNLIDQVRIPPQVGKRSVYIIDEVHMLSTQAFNAFLKTLEEPPAHAIFILATTEKHKIIPTILSRCQIFDFNRIGVEDIADHLAYVAKSEGVEASHDALNIIGQKADGAMRDALSYFDQIVSFSGNKITYENVIENLNVLDYEYYFSLVESFLNNDFASALLTFNDILNKGFDGHHFITGLSKHFRDLLVSKDQNTVKLLEIGEGIKEKYRKQAADCPLPFLFQALNIANACDLSYKASQDKRLQVELALINTAKITLQAAQPVVNQTNNESGKTAEKNAQENTVSDSTKTNEQSSTKKMSSISIKGALKGEGLKKKVIEETQDKVEEPEKEYITTDFSNEQLIGVWQQFATSIKTDKPRIYSILNAAKPEKKSIKEIQFTVKNTLQKDAIEKIESELMIFVSDKLKNNKLKLTIEIIELEEQKHLYTDSDKYKYLTEKNANLNKLKQQFNLDF